jgi:hypothetical protein
MGIEACVKLRPDMFVNTDPDNQYNTDDIPLLTDPILSGEAKIEIGTYPIVEVEHLSTLKKFLQKNGSWLVRTARNTTV